MAKKKTAAKRRLKKVSRLPKQKGAQQKDKKAIRSKKGDGKTVASEPVLCVTVQVKSRTTTNVALSLTEREQIARGVQNTLQVHWLPSLTRQRHEERHAPRNAVETVVIISVLALPFLSIAKPFFSSMASEAGKDAWSGIKALIARIWKKHTEKSYAVSSTAFVLFNLGEHTLIVPFHLPRVSDSSEVDSELDEQFMKLAESWETIQEDIKRYSLGDQSSEPFDVHILKSKDDQSLQIVRADDVWLQWL